MNSQFAPLSRALIYEDASRRFFPAARICAFPIYVAFNGQRNCGSAVSMVARELAVFGDGKMAEKRGILRSRALV